MSDTPNPGSDAAVEAGCTCSVMDNCRGRGYLGGPYFVITEGCPLHDARTSSQVEFFRAPTQGAAA